MDGYTVEASGFLQWLARENIATEQAAYNDVLHWIQTMRARVSQKTIVKHLNSVKHYYGWLMSCGAVAANPTDGVQVRGIKRRTLYDILSRSELDGLYHGFQVLPEQGPNNKQNWYHSSRLASLRNKVILGLMICQGLGSRELGRLTGQDLKLREGKIYVAGGRSSNERTLTLESHQVMDMMEYMLKTRGEILKLAGKQSDKLFVSTGSSDQFRSIIRKLLARLSKQNGKVSSAQQIRASVITAWLKVYNLREVQYMAGHRYVSSTEAYLINDLDDLSEEIGKYHPIS